MDNNYFENLKDFQAMAKTADPIHFINAMLLDERDDTREIKALTAPFSYQDKICKTVNVGDYIRNKSSLRIVFLLQDTEKTRENEFLLQQGNILASEGHEVLICSHSPEPGWIECLAHFFPVHPDSRFDSVVNSPDIVLAGSWLLVPEALKIKAPLKYLLAHKDFRLFARKDASEETKEAIRTAFTAPLKIIALTPSDGKKVSEWFGRSSVVIPDPAKAKKKLEKEFLKAAESTIQVVKLYNQK